jgi:signal transduction histidine kinase
VAERTEQLSRLTADLTAAEDRERREIARDLHDDIAQTLAVARIRLAPLLGRQDPHSRAIAKAVADLIERADVSTRSLAAQLAPPALDTLGLVPAIEWLAEEFGKLYGLSVTVENAANRPALGADERMIAYRAVRELLINVTKHAGVDRARVTMQWEAGELVIEVIDEGEGFASAEVGNGLGLRGTREALARVGGRLELESGPAGTCARLFLPCAQGDPLSEGGAA